MPSDPSLPTRTAAAIAVAACSLTIAAGVTVAALSGHLSRPPAAAAPPIAAPVATEATSGAAGVVLVPVEPAIPAVAPEAEDPQLRFASAREDDAYQERGERSHREEHDDDDD